MFDVVAYGSRMILVWLIYKSSKIILNDNNMVRGIHVHRFIENIVNILNLIKYKSIFLEKIIQLIFKIETI